MPRTKTIELTKNSRSFTFELCHRNLDFGEGNHGEYYWMDGRHFRRSSGGQNLRACIDFWWACVEEAEDSEDVANQLNLVLAECYPLVNTSRAMQSVFLNAHLHIKADRKISLETGSQGKTEKIVERTYNLPDEEYSRIRSIVDSRNILEIQNELIRLFSGVQPSGKDLPKFQEALRHWTGNGIVAFRKGGMQLLHEYVDGDLKKQITKYRKGGVDENVRLFLNLFSYESKVAFYLCYANAWAFILPILEDEHGLNEQSIRFMKMWHHQNQPLLFEGRIHQIFSGQVLSLHPLSALVLTDPSTLSVINKWVGHPDYQQLIDSNNEATSKEYWDVVLTILVAANEYKQSHQRWEESRINKEIISSPTVENATNTDRNHSVAKYLEAYVAEQGLFCQGCSGFLKYKDHEVNENLCPVIFQCQTCDNIRKINVDYANFKDHFFNSTNEEDS